MPDTRFRRRIANQICGFLWPQIEFGPRRVTIGRSTSILLVPHVNEFDFQALFGKRLVYEPEVVRFLEDAIAKYGVVIEIGANVGVYSVFLSRMLKGSSRIVSFEPSPEAFSRLLRNLSVNDATNVLALNCAVADRIGLMNFYEPQDHLTNGSLDESFARIFSSRLTSRPVLVVDGSIVEQLLGDEDKVLIKIDAEASEERILRSLSQLLGRRHPDLLLEVLPGFDDALNRIKEISEHYYFFNITTDGLIRRPRLEACAYRDWFLTAQSSTCESQYHA